MSEVIASGITVTIPTLGETNWDQVLKLLCFQKISEHDHTGGGKGVQIQTNAIANSAITSAKIADGNITAVKIPDSEITEAKLADDAATRSCILLKSRSSVAAGTAAIAEMVILGATSLKYVTVPKACKVTHLSIDSHTGKNAGTLTITLYKNGATTGQVLALGTSGSAQGAITAVSFVAGDLMSLAITTNAVGFTAPPADLVATAWGHFTA